jgi:hypothetical protein
MRADSTKEIDSDLEVWFVSVCGHVSTKCSSRLSNCFLLTTRHRRRWDLQREGPQQSVYIEILDAGYQFGSNVSAKVQNRSLPTGSARRGPL